MTVDIYRILHEQAVHRAMIRPLKIIAAETGYSFTYCQQVIKQIQKDLTVKDTVPRETPTESV